MRAGVARALVLPLLAQAAAALSSCAGTPVGATLPPATVVPAAQPRGGMPPADPSLAPRLAAAPARPATMAVPAAAPRPAAPAPTPRSATAPLSAMQPAGAPGCPPGVTGFYRGTLYCGAGT